MKLFHFLLIIIGMMVAVGVGWFYDQRPAVPQESQLQVPDNIDYYLSAVNYRAFDAQGNTRYQLQSPYLEHFIREDRSDLSQPDLQYFKDSSPWHITAKKGSLQHQNELFRLSQQVNMRRVDPLDSMLLKSELVELDSKNDVVRIPQPLTLESTDLKLQADSATMDMKHKQHQFHRVKSVYQRDNSHVSG